jgi:Predicted phosphoribosyltransferases
VIFKNRTDAGKQLAELMSEYDGAKDAIVLGLPRGGVVVAYEVAKKLHLPLDIICPRKIGAPYNQEFAIGAVTESGRGIFHEEIIAALGIPQNYIEEAVKEQSHVAQQRVKAFRQNMPPRDLKGKTVILVDDGLATGATMEAALHSVRGDGAKKIIVAVPVGPKDTIQRIKYLVDGFYCVATPPLFSAIGEFYIDFRQTEDDEVIKLLHSRVPGLHF